MTRDDIIRMAREAHLVMYDYDHPSLERFANLVAAAEREACAEVCEKDATAWGYDSNGASCAIAIRARGQE
jgi:hypothetical protein